MIELLAHGGHDHGSSPSTVALMVALIVVTAVLAASAVVRKMRS